MLREIELLTSHVLGRSILVNASFLVCEGCVPPSKKYVPAYSHLP